MTAVKSVRVHDLAYQEIALPNGAGPVSARDIGGPSVGWADFEIFYIDPETGTDVTVFGLYVIQTNNQFPANLRVFPERHNLINQVLEPNCRYVWTVGNRHLFLGAPRPQKETL